MSAEELAVLAPQLPPAMRRQLQQEGFIARLDAPAALPSSLERHALSQAQEDALRVATMLGVPPQAVAWTAVPGMHVTGLVVFTPWAKVLVARTRGGVEAFLRDWPEGKVPWLYEALCEAYSRALSPPLEQARLYEVPYDSAAVAGFVDWAFDAPPSAFWPLTPTVRVLGSWRSWREAAFVDRGDGTFQVLGRPAPKGPTP